MKRLGLAAALVCTLAALPAHAITYTFVPGGDPQGRDWWMLAANWSPNGVPNSVDDIVIFDASANPGYSTNVHSLFYVIQEMRFDTPSSWRIHNAKQDPTLDAPSGNALVTQNGSGAVTFDTDLQFVDDVVFGGTGTGTIRVTGSGMDVYRVGVWGAGGLALQGDYTLALDVAASYDGPTTINAGTLLFNGDSATLIPPGPVALAPFTVNAGGTLGGTGTLRADVTVNAGGTFAPGESAGTLTIDGHNLTLASGSTTQVELGGTTPGSGHDHAVVGGQLSLGGSLDIALTGGHVPTKGSYYTLFDYGTRVGTFDAVNAPAVPGHPEYQFLIDYDSGTGNQVTASVAGVYYYTGNYGPHDYWEYPANWDPQQEPGSVAAHGDVVVFDKARSPVRKVTNIWNNDRYVREVRFKTDDSWTLYHNHFDLHLGNPTPGVPAAFTQNDSGPVTINCDVVLDDDTIFGGGGGGRVTLNGRNVAASDTYGLRATIRGPGGLTKNGSYDLVINHYASYEGPTTINDGALIFNAESAKRNPAWVYGNPATYYLPFTMAPVTVNAGGTLGGTGILRAPVTVHGGGTFAPGESAGVLTVDSLALLTGSTTQMELGGTTPGNGTGHHDQAIVGGQLSLGGTLDIDAIGGYTPQGGCYTLFTYDTLDPGANSFDAVSFPDCPAHCDYSVHYGPGNSNSVILDVAPVYYYTGGYAPHDYWEFPENWDPQHEPGSVAAHGDIVVFDKARSPVRKVTNIWNNDRYVREVRFKTDDSWRLHHNSYDLHLTNPLPGATAAFTQNDSGPLTINCDLVLDDDTIFGGGGGGRVTLNGRNTAVSATYGLRATIRGTGGLVKNGSYDLVINNYASYEGPTTINDGALIFNAESAERNPAWVYGNPATYYLPVTMAPVTVNAGGTLGGHGILRAPVTVNGGGTFAPGESAGVFTLDSLTLLTGSSTLMELGGATPGNGSGHHDQAVVTGQASLAGTLDVALTGGHVPAKGSSYAVLTYGSLAPGAGTFDATSFPAVPGHPNYEWSIDYGTGTNSQVTLTANAMPWYFTGAAANDWWTTEGNWNYPGHPGENAAHGDVIIFDQSVSARNTTNIHAMGPAYAKEFRVITDATWRFHNNERDIVLSNPEPGQPALFTKEGSGDLTFDCDIRLDDDAIFGGGGGGRVVVNGSIMECHSGYGPRYGLTGPGGLTLDGPYTLVVSNVADYQGPTILNNGTLLFNAGSLTRNPAWVYEQPDTYYLPTTMAPVTVNAGATLGGTGDMAAEVTVNAGGTIAPGESVGTFSVDTLTLEAGSTALFELEDLLSYDELLVEDLLRLGGMLEVDLLGGYAPVAGDRFPIIQYGTLDPTANRFDALDAPHPDPTLFFFVDYGSGADDWVTLYVNIPEPASVVLLGVGAAVLGWRRRKRVPR